MIQYTFDPVIFFEENSSFFSWRPLCTIHLLVLHNSSGSLHVELYITETYFLRFRCICCFYFSCKIVVNHTPFGVAQLSCSVLFFLPFYVWIIIFQYCLWLLCIYVSCFPILIWDRCASYTFWCSTAVGFVTFTIYGVYVLFINGFIDDCCAS